MRDHIDRLVDWQMKHSPAAAIHRGAWVPRPGPYVEFTRPAPAPAPVTAPWWSRLWWSRLWCWLRAAVAPSPRYRICENPEELGYWVERVR